MNLTYLELKYVFIRSYRLKTVHIILYTRTSTYVHTQYSLGYCLILEKINDEGFVTATDVTSEA